MTVDDTEYKYISIVYDNDDTIETESYAGQSLASAKAEFLDNYTEDSLLYIYAKKIFRDDWIRFDPALVKVAPCGDWVILYTNKSGYVNSERYYIVSADTVKFYMSDRNHTVLHAYVCWEGTGAWVEYKF